MASLINQFSQVTAIPPDGFYYTLFIVLATALIWIIKVYVSRTDTTLKQLATTVSNLDKIIAVHEHKHEQHEKEIDDLKKKG